MNAYHHWFKHFFCAADSQVAADFDFDFATAFAAAALLKAIVGVAADSSLG